MLQASNPLCGDLGHAAKVCLCRSMVTTVLVFPYGSYRQQKHSADSLRSPHRSKLRSSSFVTQARDGHFLGPGGSRWGCWNIFSLHQSSGTLQRAMKTMKGYGSSMESFRTHTCLSYIVLSSSPPDMLSYKLSGNLRLASCLEI